MRQTLTVANGWLVFLFAALAATSPTGDGYGWIAVLLLLAGLAFCIPAFRGLPALTREDRTLVAVLILFFAVHVLEVVLHGEPPRGIDRPSRFLLAIPVLMLLLAFPPRPAFFWWGAITGSAAAGVITIAQISLTGATAASAWMMPIQFAALVSVLAWMSFAAIGHFRAACDRRGVAAAAAAGLLGLVAVFLSGTRGAWLVIPFALLALALSLRRELPARAWAGLAAALLVIVTVLVSVPQTGVRDGVTRAAGEVRQYLDAGVASTSPGARLELWRIALEIIPEHPWLGAGRSGYTAALRERIAAGETTDYLLTFTHPHNEILDAQVKRGLPGTLALLALYILPGYWFLRRALYADDAALRAAGLAGLYLPLVFLFSGLTQTLFAHNSGATFYAFMLVIAWAQLRAREQALQMAGTSPAASR